MWSEVMNGINVVTEVNVTTLSIFVTGVTWAFISIIWIFRQQDRIVKLESQLTASEKDREKLHLQDAVMEGRIAVLNDTMLKEYIRRDELASARQEQQQFLTHFEERVTASINRLGERLDNTLHGLAKGKMDA